MPQPTLHFSCTACGGCCNRNPEVELSETLALADVFVFRLMVRPYDIPMTTTDFDRWLGMKAMASQRRRYLEERKLLGEVASKIYPVRITTERGVIKMARHIYISAIAMDAGRGVCDQLTDDGRCSLYDRRPHACRTVPFHYSRPDATLGKTLADFLARPTHHCGTSQADPLVINNDILVDPHYRAARLAARDTMDEDRIWKDAIAAHITHASASDSIWPDWTTIDANANAGASSIPMEYGWQVAQQLSLIDAAHFDQLMASQSALAGKLRVNTHECR